jgi:hypothetical protein
MYLVLAKIIGWAALPMLAVLAGLLIWRKTLRQFPYFFYYVVVGELIGIVRLIFYNFYDPRGRLYFYIYWITDLLIAIAAFLTSYELFVGRLFPRFRAVRFYRYLFPGAAMVVACLAVPAALQRNHISIVLTAVHVFEVLRVTVLLFFVGLMIFMGRHWGRYEFGIALGLGILASALLITSARWTQNSAVLSSLLPVTAYDFACLIWLITFAKAERSIEVANQEVRPELVQTARQWEETLKDSFASKKRSE